MKLVQTVWYSVPHGSFKEFVIQIQTLRSEGSESEPETFLDVEYPAVGVF